MLRLTRALMLRLLKELRLRLRKAYTLKEALSTKAKMYLPENIVLMRGHAAVVVATAAEVAVVVLLRVAYALLHPAK